MASCGSIVCEKGQTQETDEPGLVATGNGVYTINKSLARKYEHRLLVGTDGRNVHVISAAAATFTAVTEID